MSPTRLFSPSPLRPNSRFKLDSSQSRYLMRALRLRSGDQLVVFDGSGGEYNASVVLANKDGVEIATTELQDHSAESSLSVWLVQGISKGDRMDTVVQKATELGVRRVSPVSSDFSIVKLDPKKAAKRRDHWQKIAQSACEQCGRNTLPRIDDVVSLSAWHETHRNPSANQFILSPGAAATLSSFSRPMSAITLLIGPEGGFSGTEQERAIGAGFEPVGLGPRVLRTETAAIAAISAAQTLWGDFG